MAKFRRKRLKRGPLPFRYILLLTLVFFLFSTAAGVWIINKGIEPTLMRIAESQTIKIASQVIIKAISKKTIDVGEAIAIEPGSNGAPPSAALKTNVVNRQLAEITNQIQKNLTAAEKGDLDSLEQLTDVEIKTKDQKDTDGIIWYIPIGQATNIALLGNMGPKIPVKFTAIGDLRPDVKIKKTPVGINNLWVDVIVHVRVSVQIITPIATKITTLDQDIPVGSRYIQGDVPQFYNNGGNSAPSIQLPMDDKKTDSKKQGSSREN